MSSRIEEALYSTSGIILNEMALSEMSLQNPARVIKQHISYSNKYSVQDIKNIVDKAFDDVYGNEMPATKYARIIKALSNILLADFETDFAEYADNFYEEDVEALGGEDAVGKEILEHYYKYVKVLKTFYLDCKNESKSLPDPQYDEMRKAAFSAYNTLNNGIKDFVEQNYSFWAELL